MMCFSSISFGDGGSPAVSSISTPVPEGGASKTARYGIFFCINILTEVVNICSVRIWEFDLPSPSAAVTACYLGGGGGGRLSLAEGEEVAMVKEEGKENKEEVDQVLQTERVTFKLKIFNNFFILGH